MKTIVRMLEDGSQEWQRVSEGYAIYLMKQHVGWAYVSKHKWRNYIAKVAADIGLAHKEGEV